MPRLAALGGSPVRSSPFPPWPQAGPEELEELRKVLESGRWSSSHGDAVPEFERRFAAFQEAGHGVCVHSGEAALRLALVALGLSPGDEVIVPAYTFVGSATAVIQAGGRPVFADVDPGTWCLSPGAVAELVGPRTFGVMTVHFAGLPGNLEELRDLCDRHGLVLVEDAAQAWGARTPRRAVGAIGRAGAFSFQASKNLSAGEGGIVLTDDAGVAARCRSLADCGRTGDRRYHHEILGGNYRMTEFQGAVLKAQLGRYPELHRRRDAAARALEEALAGIDGVVPQQVPPGFVHARHLLVVQVAAEAFGDVDRRVLVRALAAEGIPATPGYVLPAHLQPLFADDPPRHGPCPVAEELCEGGALWFRHNLLMGGEEDAVDVARALAKLQESVDELRSVDC